MAMNSTTVITIVGLLVPGIAVLGCSPGSDDFDPGDTAEPRDAQEDGADSTDAEAARDITPPSDDSSGSDADADADADASDTLPPLPCGDAVCDPDEHCTS
ncbi:MAG: hypothetical protein QME96_15010, partial [Myxococcota bacterium]|nr:hypothetical protein [Myxococcota bacterium]